MKLNPFNLKKKELQVYLTGYCKHRMPYQQHPKCFINEVLHNEKEYRTGILDIETHNLYANCGILLTYYIKDYHIKKYFSGKIKKKELQSNNIDKELTKQLVKDLSKFQRIITYYGSRFDIPFIRSKALHWKIKFPKYKYIEHVDVYYMVRHKLKLTRNTLENACRFLHINGKNHIDLEIWIKAVTGDRKSLDYIFKHNKYDVDILEKLYDKLVDFSMKTKRSI